MEKRFCPAGWYDEEKRREQPREQPKPEMSRPPQAPKDAKPTTWNPEDCQ